MLPITSALLIFVGTYTNKEDASRGIYAEIGRAHV